MEKQTKKIEEEDLERKRERERGTERERDIRWLQQFVYFMHQSVSRLWLILNTSQTHKRQLWGADVLTPRFCTAADAASPAV